jgi:hypothetical protein
MERRERREITQLLPCWYWSDVSTPLGVSM